MQQLDKVHGANQDDDMDSEFSEVLSELDKEDGNTQDLKDMMKKKKLQGLKRKLKSCDLELKPQKRKGKGKGKGKGRGKGRGRSRIFKKRNAKFRMPKKTPASAPAGGDLAAPSSSSVAAAAPPEASLPESLMADDLPASSAVAAELVMVPEGAAELVAQDFQEGSKGSMPVHQSRAGHIKVYKSPEELLRKLQPPLCTFGLDYNLHRWNSSFKVPPNVHESAGFPYNQKSMTCSFNQQMTWKSALIRVHHWNWTKWEKLNAKGHAPLPPGEVAQTPGSIPDDVALELSEVVTKLPPYKKYVKKS